jgi:Xaa-Pro aminopeptidase
MDPLRKVQELLPRYDIEGLLVTNTYNRRYVTNFTGSAGAALILAEKAYFITDFRYTEQAKEQVKGYEIIQHNKSFVDEASRIVKVEKIGKLGFEQDHVTFSLWKKLEQSMEAELVPVSNIIEELRMVKTEEEKNTIKEAARIADAAFAHILDYIKPGVAELDIAHELEFFMRKNGATSSAFDMIVASGKRSALPHGIASSKKIENGDFVTLDYGALYQGYVSDITRTVAVGKPSSRLREIYGIVLDAQKTAIEKIGPGMTGKEADAIARDLISEKGYGDQFGHSLGHGIGLEVHEGPGLAKRSETKLLPGMVVTVEPGIYLPEMGGVRIEDDIFITDKGNEILTHAPKEFIIL